MNPRLLVVAGPLRGSTYVLSAKEVQIGRDSSDAFAIGDPALSRRHCVLACEGNDYIIRDLQSRNGTLINGVAAQKRGLQHGDQISVEIRCFSSCRGMKPRRLPVKRSSSKTR